MAMGRAPNWPCPDSDPVVIALRGTGRNAVWPWGAFHLFPQSRSYSGTLTCCLQVGYITWHSTSLWKVGRCGTPRELGSHTIWSFRASSSLSCSAPPAGSSISLSAALPHAQSESMMLIPRRSQARQGHQVEGGADQEAIEHEVARRSSTQKLRSVLDQSS